jgi:hypothetical protein
VTDWEDDVDEDENRFATPPVTPNGPATEVLLKRVMDVINNTRPMPLSSSHLLNNKDEVIELLEDAVSRLPDELRQARWMLKERE